MYFRTAYRKLLTAFSFIGPGMMVAVGYIDPGNWATDLAAGSEFNYNLLFIILLSNIMAIILQHLSLKLGIVTNMDLAQNCRKYFPRFINLTLYIFCEIAIIAMDLAEVIGTAIALNLLFGLPIVWGVAITGLDVLFLMMGWGSKNGVRIFELFIILMVSAVATCFIILLVWSKPDSIEVLKGYIPNAILGNSSALYLAMGIIGATVMPHNLYLHSSIVKYRSPMNAEYQMKNPSEQLEFTEDDYKLQIDWLEADGKSDKLRLIEKNIYHATIETTASLSLAFFINSSILIVSAATFFTRDKNDVADLKDAFNLLNQYIGRFAGIIFASALLLSGQSSTITGTLAGQVVMEGFLGKSFKIPRWSRRLITRGLAIVPAMLVAIIKGENGLNDLLVLSQVILSLQLPFAIWPLIYFTCSKKLMDSFSESSVPLNVDDATHTQIPVEDTCSSHTSNNSSVLLSDMNGSPETKFANSTVLSVAASSIALLITGLNVWLLISFAKG